jgi:hypothetical protein
VSMSYQWWGKFTRDPETGCLLWTGTIDRAGYGRSKGNGAAAGEVYVHRIVWILRKGPIPADKELDHVRERGCRYRHCAEVDHMEPVTHPENQRRSIKSHCKRGHPLSGDNLYIDPIIGQRRCKACNALRGRELRARRRNQGSPAASP